MEIEMDDDYVEWVKRENLDLFAPGQDEESALAHYINAVLLSHRRRR